MRLLDTSSLELREFQDNEIPAYAILSHTWEKDEVSFQDMQSDKAKKKAGYMKIMGACKEAMQDNLEYIWIDTCCIDKSSSAELTEAINSMFRWYQNALVCYAYLSDVLRPMKDESAISAFERSRWFTRGWTLQELIAPRILIFFSKHWERVGTKAQLLKEVSQITGVSSGILRSGNLRLASVAAKMSWASKRITTRVEDGAYCLMGLFDVNMPLLYGEGRKAFIRLQEEIMKISDDHSIFAWRDTSHIHAQPPRSGLLARSPAYFLRSQNIVSTDSLGNKAPFVTTNRGLFIEMIMISVPESKNSSESGSQPWPTDNAIAVLDCVDTRDPNAPLGILMDRVAHPLGERFHRASPHQLFSVTQENRRSKDRVMAPIKALYVRQQLNETSHPPVYQTYVSSPQPPKSVSQCRVHPRIRWTPLNEDYMNKKREESSPLHLGESSITKAVS